MIPPAARAPSNKLTGSLHIRFNLTDLIESIVAVRYYAKS